MSWDIFVQDFPESFRSGNEIPDGFQPPLLGRRPDLISRILEVVPFADFSNPAWGRIDGPAFCIEVNVGDEAAVYQFEFPVRGGEMAAAVITETLLHPGLGAFDPTDANGTFDVDGDPAIGLRK